MIIVTTPTIPNKEIVEVKGFVKGSTVRAKHLGKDFAAAFKMMAGGELKEYNEMLVEARQVAMERMVEDAKAQGANAIIGLNITTSAIVQGSAEILAYGTGVVVQ
ncbi:MAG: hypothetical protein ATN35_00480 [Epulopiscium sp. Nele67-Bin004]|nr:MAG: hypothetical protein ATN35_00480 [Epulopiscium sp. Nele67-Bin004]